MNDVAGKYVKYLLFLFNLLIFVVGLALMIISLVFMTGYNDKLENLLDGLIDADVFETMSYLILAGGAIVAVISFLGCWGAYRENKCLLTMYGLILVVMVVMLGAGAFMYFTSRSEVDAKLQEQLKLTLTKYSTDDKVKTAWDNIQKQLECCGVSEGSNWKSVNISLPSSCCIDSGCTESYETGCYTVVGGKMKQVATVGVIAWIIIIVTIGANIAVIFGIRSGYDQNI